MRQGADDDFVLPSRASALAGLASAVESRLGPVVLTGEPGAGKTWVSQRLRATLSRSWRWVSVDLSPSIDTIALYDLILHALGVPPAAGPAGSRAALEDLLIDGAADGFRWGLIVDESHLASDAILEELRVFGNKIGHPGAISGLVLVGQTAMARRLASRSLAALDARIVARVHLRPLGVEELRDWLGFLDSGRAWNEDALEQLHRDTAGNPRRIVTQAKGRSFLPGTLAKPAPRIPLTAREPAPLRVEAPRSEPAVAWEAAAVAPGKPPIQVGEGMIEVGWDASPEPDFENDETAIGISPSAAASGSSTTISDGSQVVIDDHYAALQAWTEWAQNQGRDPIASASQDGAGPAGGLEETADAELDPDENPAARISSNGNASVRAEGQHEFAPYSQLFSRLRESRDSH